MRLNSTVLLDDAGKLLLRLTLGMLILLHGAAKIFGGVQGIASMVEANGLPGSLAYLVYIGEVLAPLALIAGWWTRIAALVVAVNMVVAILLAHRADILALTGGGGWALELQGMFLFTALALALLGSGRYAVRED